ncbi:MAG TPA: arsenosugar biosynthesis radical SAM (seleno)protein ArsS [Candidatus Limnocylindria bacterium]|nr:arsenosugar biosynthesis radical SAM (seleno)protein ArsS [Candidatus Limnocylindria bacterium]
MSAAFAQHLPVLQTEDEGDSFAGVLKDHGLWPLVRGKVTTLQVNVGRLCNMACHHCHVEAGPKRIEIMPSAVAERVALLLERNPGVEVVDLTGGAPELNPSFRWLVTEARRLRRRVIDRCNLTVLFEPGMEDLAEFMAANEVQIVASLPCYQAENVEKQRGRGAFDKSIEALRKLNGLGYGRPGSKLKLDLVYNPVGAFLPPPQAKLEAKYREELSRLFGIEFDQLLTITNMPIKRFAHLLERTGKHEAYMSLLVNHFNPRTVPELMCRSLVSVGWDGQLFDCDFNQMLEMPLGAGARTLWDVDALDELVGSRVAVAQHCFGCTAGAGSSCSGALR